MFKGVHPYKLKTYIFDNNMNIHIANSSIQTKLITHDFLQLNKKLKQIYLNSINRKKNINNKKKIMSKSIITNSSINHITLIELHIKSFSVIKLNHYWLQDLENLIYNYNIKYLMNKLKYLNHKLKTTYSLITNLIKRLYSLPNNIKIKIQLSLFKQLRKMVNIIIEVVKLKKWFLKRICVIRLPRTKPQINVLKSPHVFKKAQDHYEIRNHKVVIQIPLLILKQDFISSIIEQTTKLDSLYRIHIKRKKILIMTKNFNNEHR